eukprot:13597914-Ditylum_brightwellii.AAC.1
MLQKLREFRTRHGHCRINTKGGPLGRWVTNQRKSYNRFIAGKSSNMTKEREKLLTDAGFVFVGKRGDEVVYEDLPTDYKESAETNLIRQRGRGHSEVQFNTKLQDFIEFKRKHGHGVVPTTFGKLGTWVSEQRRMFKLKEMGRPCQMMTDERVEKLRDAGFVFSVGKGIKRKMGIEFTPRKNADRFEAGPSWDEMYVQLQAFKQENGNTN